MPETPVWDVAVVGAGPAGLAAARTAAAAGARTVVLERARHPRYKTCGGGLIQASLSAVAGVEVPARDTIDAVTFTHHGRRAFTRSATGRPLLLMVGRDEFDDALRAAAVAAGAVVRERVTARAVTEDGPFPLVRLAGGGEVAARVVIGADGSAGVTARHVGVACDQVDLGLELELPVPPQLARRWRGRVLIDWGPIPGSYAWVFPKGDRLTVGVIAAKGEGDRTRAYLRGFRNRLGLSGLDPEHDTGHLTRCRADGSPLRRGRVIVAGDAAGLVEPWTREGISYALRSGALAGAAAASGDLDGYVAAVQRTLVPELDAGRALYAAFSRRPSAFHAGLATRPGWHAFTRFCRGETSWDQIMRRAPVRAAVGLLAAGHAPAGTA